MSNFENDTFVDEGGEGLKGMPSRAALHALITMQVFICIGGTIGNLLTLFLYRRRAERRTYIVGIITLASKDLVCCFLLMPLSIIVEALEFRIYNDFFCKIFHLIHNINIPVTLFVLTLLAADRCASVCHSSMHSFRRKPAVISVIVILVLSFGLSIVPSLGVGVWSTRPLTSVLANFTIGSSSGSSLYNIGYCHVNNVTIPFKSMMKYFTFYKFLFSMTGIVMGVAYGTTLAFLMHRRYRPTQPILGSPMGELGSSNLPYKTTEDTCGSQQERGMSTQTSEGSQSTQPEKEQKTFALVFFIVTVIYWVLMLPALLMVHGHVEGKLLFFFCHQLQYATNPLVYATIDATFRQEARDLFRASRSRLIH